MSMTPTPTRANPGCAFILGSGRSMLEMTESEKAALSAHPFTLAMNKYLLFWRTLGIIPADFFLADRQYPAQYVYRESVREARRLPCPPRIFVNEYYSKLYPRSRSDLAWARKERRKLHEQHDFTLPWFRFYRKMHFFKSGLDSSRPFFWGRSLADELYFYRGSLTTAINLATILYPVRRICLIGVDLNTHAAFYEEEISRMPVFHEKANDRIAERQVMARESNTHATALDYRGVPGVQAVLPQVAAHLKSLGIELVCANPASLLVEQGILPHAQILECAVMTVP